MGVRRCRADLDQQEEERVTIRSYGPVERLAERLAKNWASIEDYLDDMDALKAQFHEKHGEDISPIDVLNAIGVPFDAWAAIQVKQYEAKCKVEISMLHKVVGNLRHSTVKHDLGSLNEQPTADLGSRVIAALEQAVEERTANGTGKGVSTPH